MNSNLYTCITKNADFNSQSLKQTNKDQPSEPINYEDPPDRSHPAFGQMCVIA
mgnify:FL=1